MKLIVEKHSETLSNWIQGLVLEATLLLPGACSCTCECSSSSSCGMTASASQSEGDKA